MYKKRPGKAEKAMLRKKRALDKDAAKCAKLADLFFKKTNGSGNR